MAKKKTTRKKSTAKKKSSSLSSMFNLKDERTKKILGSMIILFGVFLFLAFVSFLFTWNLDFDLFHRVNGSSDYFDENPNAVANWMKSGGAFLSYFFIYHGFGLTAFTIPVLLAVIGLRIYTGKKGYSIYSTLKYSLIIIVFFSVLLALLFQNSMPPLAGAFGFGVFSWMKSIVGNIGVILFLLFFLASVLLWNFEFDLFSWMGRRAVNTYSKAKNVRGGKAHHNTEENDDHNLDRPEESLFEKDNITLPTEEPSNDFEIIRTAEESPIEEVSAKPKPVEPQVKPSDPESDLSLTIEESKDTEEVSPKEIKHQTIDTLYDPRLDLSEFKFPEIELLNAYQGSKTEVTEAELTKSKNLIEQTLINYKIGISSIKATIGPTVTLFEIVPAPGVKISKIKNLEDDIALSLAALGIRIIAPIPGKGTIGIEVPNKKPEIVSMRSVLLSKKYQESKYDLPVCLGKTISNEVYVADLAKMPHLLMAGATGQGKSVGLNALLVSLLYKKHPAEIKFVLVDPKKVELTLFRKIERHYLAKLPGDGEAIITENKLVVDTLNSLCIEMDNRYQLLQDALVRNIKEYNEKFKNRKLNPNDGHRFLPYIVVVVDEVADLIMTAGKEVEHPVGRLAQLARAIGIHLVLATQRPSVNIITGTIKANFPARAAFRVTSKIDSRTILDGNGADQLIGKGDMLYSTGSDIIRLQCPFVDTPEVEKITSYIGDQRAYPSAYLLPEVQDDSGGGNGELDPSDRDDLFEDAARIVVQHQQGSTSLIQRRLKVGYNRAGRLIDQLEQANIVGPFEGSKARAVLLPDEYALEQYLNEL